MRSLKYMFLLVFVIISGCWDRTEINDLAFVTGTALDLTDDGNILCTLQIAIPSSAEGGMSGGESGNKFFVIAVEGKNGNDIHHKLQKKSSRRLLYSHRSVVFLSERMAKHGIDNLLDIFTHDPRNRLKTYLMVVKGGEARNILQLNSPLKQVPIETVRGMEVSGEDIAVTLRDFFIAYGSEGVHPVVGVVEPEIHSNDPHKQIIRVAGAGVFKDLKLAGLLDVNETSLGLMWVTDKLKVGYITANLPKENGAVGMVLTHADRKIITQTQHDSVQFRIQLEGQGILDENTTALDINEPKDLKLIKKALEDEAKKQVQNFIFKIQKKYKVDSVGFGQEIYKNYPDKWDIWKNQWDMRFPESEISIEVNLTIKGAGMVHSSFESRGKEVK
ncbi:Ger(x)C family spore germination protein [Paenibacillus sp. WQ 127069]|uniref:Ger(X)C family spore germination protein n=1 Tax=Paenibacillus baimaensis TaxID=2982185 RepID=A0ABT2UB31_9BACL|nr:Ger(x)C family spore germination protein [Paenibacillus sp. WQ 127069]MCU6791853.1 Ger(x)C family spore germination protein [Paenibacillus sp. WQ 127069]